MGNKDYKRVTIPDTEIYGKAGSTGVYRRLYDLENAIEDGTLVFLPCKVGDTVWFVNKYRPTKQIEPYIVDRITLTSSKTILDTHQAEPPQNIGLIYSDSFGRNVLFTKESAEKALEELKK